VVINMLLKAETDESPYEPVFRLWIQNLPNLWPSRLTADGKAVRGSITRRRQYNSLWNVLHEKELLGSSHYQKSQIGVQVSDAYQDTNLRNLAKLIMTISDEDAIVAITGRKKVDVREIAHGITRALGDVPETKASGRKLDQKTLLRELKQRFRFLEAFTIAIDTPPNFDPDTALEVLGQSGKRQMPYRISEDKNVASLASSINRNDMDVFEKIFEARGGSETEQKAYNINFDEADKKIQRFWKSLRVMLRNPIEYYTTDFEQKEEPLFNALVYIFNQFGKGKGGERFFNRETQKKIRDVLTAHKDTLRKPKTRIAELAGTPAAREHADKVRAKAREAILAYKKEKGFEAKLSHKEEEEISSVLELEAALRKDGVDTKLELGAQGFELWAENADGKMVPHKEYLQNPQEGNDE
jgi:hypothetical protein